MYVYIYISPVEGTRTAESILCPILGKIQSINSLCCFAFGRMGSWSSNFCFCFVTLSKVKVTLKTGLTLGILNIFEQLQGYGYNFCFLFRRWWGLTPDLKHGPVFDHHGLKAPWLFVANFTCSSKGCTDFRLVPLIPPTSWGCIGLHKSQI